MQLHRSQPTLRIPADAADTLLRLPGPATSAGVTNVPLKAKPDSKFALNDLHQEIDLFDRRIAYCQTLEKFDSQDERESALRKLGTKSGSLVKAALAMAGRGIEYDPKYVPRSFEQLPASAKEAQ